MLFMETCRPGTDSSTLSRLVAPMALISCEVITVALEGARVIIRGGEAYLVGAFVPPYQPANIVGEYDPYRTRRLLLKKKELAELAERGEQRGLTIIPLSVYNKGRFLKVKIAVARGKKKFDKREDLKKKESKRDIARDLKSSLTR